MFAEREAAIDTAGQERRDAAQNDLRILGHVVHCDGARATIAAYADTDEGAVTGLWTVGKMISINLGATRTVGLVYSIGKANRQWDASDRNAIEVSVELIGEVRDVPASGALVFDRGITQYPHIGAIAHRIRARDIKAIYDIGGRRSITLGTLSQDEAIEANVAIDDTLARHFAVVGTTGVGKSTAVGLLLRKTVEARPDLRVLILDPHNEFAAALPNLAFRFDTNTLDLPFWLFRLEELAEVLFRGREIVAEELELLRDLIPIAKQLYRSGATTGLMRRTGADALTADLPVPYRMADLIRLIDERMGQLDAKTERPAFRALRQRIESAVNDPRYRFMFGSRLIEDTIHQTVGKIFRMPRYDKPIACFEMAGLPPEVVNSSCSVLARLAFDLAMYSEGAFRLLLMCEEAHRYIPADARLGFAPTRHALSRIAKEGRKYGCFLGVVTQRPGELDPTILSQCSTVFAMRLANEQDQAIIRSAVADSSASSLTFLSSMGQREAIAFGDGVAATMRMKFEKLPKDMLPGKRDQDEDLTQKATDVDLYRMVDRMRSAQRAPAFEPSDQAEAQLAAAVSAQEAASPIRQAGDPGFTRPSGLDAPLRRSTIESEAAPGMRLAGFGSRARG